MYSSGFRTDVSCIRSADGATSMAVEPSPRTTLASGRWGRTAAAAVAMAPAADTRTPPIWAEGCTEHRFLDERRVGAWWLHAKSMPAARGRFGVRSRVVSGRLLPTDTPRLLHAVSAGRNGGTQLGRDDRDAQRLAQRPSAARRDGRVQQQQRDAQQTVACQLRVQLLARDAELLRGAELVAARDLQRALDEPALALLERRQRSGTFGHRGREREDAVERQVGAIDQRRAHVEGVLHDVEELAHVAGP